MTRLESKLAQIHVTLTGPTRQQVLQLMMTRLESKLAQTHVALTGLTRQQVLQLMMTRIVSFSTDILLSLIIVKEPEGVDQTCSVKQFFLEISQNSQENTCARASFLIKLHA